MPIVLIFFDHFDIMRIGEYFEWLFINWLFVLNITYYGSNTFLIVPLLPNQYILLLVSITILLSELAATWHIGNLLFVKYYTDLGFIELVSYISPVPSWPQLFLPHVYTFFNIVLHIICDMPHESWFTFSGMFILLNDMFYIVSTIPFKITKLLFIVLHSWFIFIFVFSWWACWY